LRALPAAHQRGRLLVRLIVETGLRVGETLSIHVEDIDLTRDDEHVSVRGKGGRCRTLLLDDSTLVGELRRYLRRTGYTRGHLFPQTYTCPGVRLTRRFSDYTLTT